MKPTKQTVYLPVKINESTKPHISLGYGKVAEEQEGYFFTPEQLNQYTQAVIKQALGTAAEKAEPNILNKRSESAKFTIVDVDKESITNTFEEMFKQFKV